jgi:uncharacterized membrane protein
LFGVEKVAGLPVHVLIVHFAVVLVPLAAIALIATGWKAEWRRRYALAVALMAIAGAASAFIAAQTGESLQRTITQSAYASGQQVARGEDGLLGEHPEQGDNAEIAAIAFAVAASVFFGLEQWNDRIEVLAPEIARWRPAVSYVAACGFAVVALATMVIAGHSGATLVWKDVGNFVSTG